MVGCAPVTLGMHVAAEGCGRAMLLCSDRRARLAGMVVGGGMAVWRSATLAGRGPLVGPLTPLLPHMFCLCTARDAHDSSHVVHLMHAWNGHGMRLHAVLLEPILDVVIALASHLAAYLKA